ncbi:hypothetical protein SAMN05444008_102415 [Cnuella takakiae]|uniref:Ribbon-helix-helix protein, copG family n=1 Tax=Cnuella takakiae TaxID=1302690 RepID=A0A1M4VX85_9BACT|nr:hypothetical protein SAMN05444008_102415 [Cnuella takakiae]
MDYVKSHSKTLNNMASEIKVSKAKVTAELSPSLRDKFNRKCKKNGTSAAQQLRDLIQQFVKG